MSRLAAIDMGLVLVWGTIATLAMTVILEGARRLHVSRMSLPFIFGAFLTGNPNRMSAIGFLAYLAGGLLFAVLYAWFFEAVGRATVWLGLAAGALHGVWLLVVFLPILGEIHPRMATARTGPTALKRLEAPGIAGIHYGLNTPLVTLAGQLVYGGLLGFGYDASG